MNFFLTVGAMSSALIAALQGVAAHGGLLNVPWMRLLRNPKLAGGLSAIFLNAVWLLAWIVVVAGASTGMGLLAALLRPAAAFAATIVGVSQWFQSTPAQPHTASCRNELAAWLTEICR